MNKNHCYSYSQLETFRQCPYSFYLQKVEKTHENEMVQNSFAEQGTLIHDLIDKWAKGELTAGELPYEYEKRYPVEVSNNWPKMLAAKGYADKTYQQGLQYLENFDEFEGYDVLESEYKFKTKIDGRNFVGVIDMILKDQMTNEIIILDHKSKSLDAFKKEEDEMYKQQLIYSKAVEEKYGAYPDLLAFNLFKEGGLMMYRPFDKAEYDKVYTWACDTIKKIENCDIFDWYETMMDKKRKKAIEEGKDPNKVKLEFFCSEICSCRKICPEVM